MKILVLNSGSSSLKYQVIDMETEEMLAKGYFERIGQSNSFLTHKVIGQKHKFEHYAKNHEQAIEFVISRLINPHYGVLKDLSELGGIGHRVVHGGEKFSDPVLITEDVIKEIEKCSDLAPLHNPAAILGIRACQAIVPDMPMVAVFDTAFHQTLEKEKYIYPIPYEYYKKYGVRKYGFHGTSHKYVSQRLGEIEGISLEGTKIVTCHLGQGSSICAIKDGKSIDTSMGLTPLGGIPMVTRSGDLDPSVITFIMKKENIDASEMEDILNKKSGLASISGMAPDFRVIEEEADNGSEDAKIAIEKFNYSIASYIAKYAVAMKGIDYLIFTGGIGENQINIRKGICEKLKFMGVDLDLESNNVRSEEKVISTKDSKIKVYIIPTNEELMIAKETKRIISE